MSTEPAAGHIDTLALQEAKASSEIENIVTTQDELFQADLFPEGPQSGAVKELALYRDAIKLGFERLRATDGLITNATIIDMFQLLKGRSDGFRSTPGTALKNEATNGIVYVPPQDQREIVDQMSALERFVNDDEISSSRWRSFITSSKASIPSQMATAASGAS